MGRLAPQGFTVEDHDLTLYGRCKDCAPLAPKAAKRNSPGSHAHKQAPKHTHGHRG
jgi:Fur family ferric uptake transcriptional regulator